MHRPLRGCVPAALAAAWLCCQPAAAADYYVSPSGDDGAAGTEAEPWGTIGRAAGALAPGDTIFIMAGTYSEQVVPEDSGIEGNLVTYAAYPGDEAVIDGDGIAVEEWGGLIQLRDLAYIRITGLRVRNSSGAGIHASGCSAILIDANTTYNTVSSGVGVWNSTSIIVEGNDVALACNDGSQECITVAGSDSFEIRYNHVHDGGPGSNGGEGIDAKHGSNGKVYGNIVHGINRLGIYVDAWDTHTFNIEVYGNVSYDNQANGFAVAAENGGLLENIRVYNNVAYHNLHVGLTVAGWGVDGVGHPMRDIFIVNNTFFENGEEWGGGISVDNPEAENVVVRNNIVAGNLSFSIASDGGPPAEEVTVDHNLIEGFRDYPGEMRGTDAVEAPPAFADPAAADFHLLESSPAIDSASADGAPAFDFDGGARPQGEGFDIGAFEFGAPVPEDDGEAPWEWPEPPPDESPETADGVSDAPPDVLPDAVTDAGQDGTADATQDAAEEGEAGGEGCGCRMAA